MIRLTIPSIDEQDLEAVSETLATGYLVQGPRVMAFEETVAAYVGTRYAVAVTNCTAALHLGLLALGVGVGDKVAVTTYSWPATANVITLCGAEPIFVDINPMTFNMDPDHLERVMRQDSKIKVILPVHTFGGLADMPRLIAIGERYGVLVLEDAACALGAGLSDRRAGAWGALGCFSFHPRKAITTGEGGMITTDRSDLARTVKVLRNHGLDPDAPTPDFIAAGYNVRMTEFQAALGISQMAKVDRITRARQAAAARYNELLQGSVIRGPRVIQHVKHVYQSYVVLLPEEAAPYRADLFRSMREAGIETTIGTYHVPMTTFFRTRYGYKLGDFPVTDSINARAMSLPLYEGISLESQEHVVRTLLRLVGEEGAR